MVMVKTRQTVASFDALGQCELTFTPGTLVQLEAARERALAKSFLLRSFARPKCRKLTLRLR